MLAALAVLLILLGALGSALVSYRSGERVDVLVAKTDIEVGDRITGDEFATVRVAADSRHVVDSRFRSQYVDSVAVGSIPAGTLINSAMFKAAGDGGVVPDNAQLVGMVVDISKRTTRKPEVGEVVGLYFVSNGAGENVAFMPGDPILEAVRVMDVSSGRDSVSLTVLVPKAEAGVVASLAATGSIAVTLLADGTKPVVDTE